MLIARGHLELNNDTIVARCYDFLKNHNLNDFDLPHGQLSDKLSTVVMAMYLNKNNLKHLMPHHWEEFRPLIDVIRHQSNNEEVKDSWFNILPPNTALREHSHQAMKIRGVTKYASFVYYPQMIQSISPMELLIDGVWIPIPVSAGDWICFELDDLHRVSLNTSDHHRISFAFNV